EHRIAGKGRIMVGRCRLAHGVPRCKSLGEKAEITAAEELAQAGTLHPSPIGAGLPARRGRAIAFGETVAFFSSVIPAQARIQRPETRHSPLDSRFRGNDGTERSENPNAIVLPAKGGEVKPAAR